MKGSTAQAANDSGRAELRTVVDNRPTGEFLRAARLARDEDLQTVAQNLRIRRPYLEAIENGQPQNLPGTTYAIGFVRAYAEYLDLDADRIVASFKAEAQTHEEQTQLVFPEPMPGSRVPSGAVILVALLLIAGAYGGWMYLSSEDGTLAEMVPPLPESLRSLISDPPAPVTEQAAGDPAQVAAPAAGSGAAAVPADEPETAAPVASTTAGAEEQPTTTAPVAGVPESSEPPLPEPAPLQGVTADAVSPPNPGATMGAQDAQEAVPAPASSDSGSLAQSASGLVRPPTPAVTDRTDTVAAAADGRQAASEPATEPADAVASGEAAAAQAPVASDPPTPAIPRAGGEGSTVVYGAQDEPSRILIRARQPSWVEITGGDGEVLLTRLLRRGDVYMVPDRPGIRLVTGNAGGLEFEVDGATVPDIGPVGSVRRNVLLEPAALSSGQASRAGDG